MTLRIGVLGGAFNPVHTGHLLVASNILAALKLDCILFIPCAVPPLKRSSKLASAEHRLNMINLAIKENPSFKLSRIELNRKGKSYSVDTLKELNKIYNGKAKFFFIIGSDNLRVFPLWKDSGGILKLATLVAVQRPGCLLAKKRMPAGQAGVKVVNVPTLPVSSTDIRTLVKKGKSIKYLVPEMVRRYILDNRLYCG